MNLLDLDENSLISIFSYLDPYSIIAMVKSHKFFSHVATQSTLKVDWGKEIILYAIEVIENNFDRDDVSASLKFCEGLSMLSYFLIKDHHGIKNHETEEMTDLKIFFNFDQKPLDDFKRLIKQEKTANTKISAVEDLFVSCAMHYMHSLKYLANPNAMLKSNQYLLLDQEETSEDETLKGLFVRLFYYCSFTNLKGKERIFKKITYFISYFAQSQVKFNYGELLPYLPVIKDLFKNLKFLYVNRDCVEINITLGHAIVKCLIEKDEFEKPIICIRLFFEIGSSVYDEYNGSDIKEEIVDRFEKFIEDTYAKETLNKIPAISWNILKQFFDLFKTFM